ncbi:peptidoglycan bridge formation glycyltransferase FemA/FemB family protein [Cellulomonas sp. NTE-D12]|uniref:lipid II:glycine glycyltransferase FemX n=1 Tax=Cellulomonas sp. NTE-D12 TaxID=2962632 RepID=UPI0030821A6B|nr:methicillin resistance protein [Cellulomonas sp. NTE-D12]
MPPTPSPLVVTPVHDRAAWDALVRELGGHPLQLWGWGEVKATGPWRAHRLHVTAADRTVGVAQVLVRRLPFPFRALSYVPRGPAVAPTDPTAAVGYGVGDEAMRSAVAQAVVSWCRANVGGVGVSFEPDWPEGTSLPLTGAVPGDQPILLPSTIVLDLTRSADELMAAMSRTTRADVRSGGREVEIRRVTDEAGVRAVLEVYRETAQHAGFALHSPEYYLSIHRELGDASVVVAAFHEGRPCSFVWDVMSGTTAFELYGGVNEAGRKARANAPVKWFAVRLAQDAGLLRYDVNGLLNDGVSTFKRSFAKHEDQLVGTVDVPFSPLYRLWVQAVPLAKRVLRTLRRH